MQTFQMARRALIFLALIYMNLSMMPVLAQEHEADAVVGIWQADDGTVKFDIYKNSGEVQARLLYGNELVEADNVTFKKDAKNPDPAMRSRSMKNVVFIWGLHWDGSQWTGGSLYDGSSGRTYSCQVQIKDGKLYLRGYLGLPVMGQTKVFHRAHA